MNEEDFLKLELTNYWIFINKTFVMSIFKSYFSKNNTIISDSYTNTAKNPVSELFYGGFHTRFLLQIDLSELKYWNVELQEAYFSYVESSIKREKEDN